jgi:hypothetical protein
MDRQAWKKRLIRENAYRDVWLVITTAMALWAVFATLAAVRENHRSLCAWRADLEHRVESGIAFQRAHPHGAYGFSPALIAKSISDQRRTITAFRNLHCKQ